MCSIICIYIIQFRTQYTQYTINTVNTKNIVVVVGANFCVCTQSFL